MAAFEKVLVANRGEIAVRVFRTLRELGIGCVAVYSEPDAGSRHVGAADEAYAIGRAAAQSYLIGERIVEVALRAGAEAIHPGYGFLAENAAFARARRGGGARLDRPPPRRSRRWARRSPRGSGCGGRRPDRPGHDGAARLGGRPRPARRRARLAARDQGLGRWRRQGAQGRADPDEAERAFESARREGEAYFSDATVYIERYLEDPRHVEVQVLADAHGNVIHLGERDCTIQRRHQKLVEETPSPAVDDELRERIGRIAVDAARAVGYRSARGRSRASSREGEYFFLEMNTRIQVEHTVTEMATGLDLVREQVLIAAGEPLSVAPGGRPIHGHAIECRINAEDPPPASFRARGGSRTTASPPGPASASTRASRRAPRSRRSTTRWSRS